MIYTKQELIDKGMDDNKIEEELKYSRLFKIEDGYYSDTQIYGIFDLVQKKKQVEGKETNTGPFFIGFFGN